MDRLPAERASFLDAACDDDAELRAEVGELLVAEGEGLPILEASPPIAPVPASADETTAWSEPVLEPGSVLSGRFEIVRQIGVGGMGEVYEAEDRELGRRVALKTLLAGRAGSASAMARFRREIHLAQQVTHRNVCRVFDLVRDADLVFLTMELLGGETLAARLDREAPLRLAATREILEQVATALEAAHAAGVVHRDLKPSNVVLVEEPSGLRVVVTDFGLATSGGAEAAQEAQLTRTGEMVGTPAYMAPEQLEGADVGPATDVYALGLLLYEMVTGRQPFAGGSAFSVATRRLQGLPPPPRVHRPDLDERWEAVILRCLERLPSDRFQHPREVVAALDDLSVPLPAPGAGRRRPRWLLPVAAAAVVVTAALALLGWPDTSNGPPADAASGDVVAQLETATTSSPRAGTAESGVSDPIQDRRWLLIADFDNRTGEEVLTGTLEMALFRELSGSRLVSPVPRQRVADTLRRMARPIDTRLRADLAHEVALRDGRIALVLSGRVEKLGESYVLGAVLTRPQGGEAVASLSEEVHGRQDVLIGVRRLAEGVQRSLAEALPSGGARRTALPAVSTPSLAALKLYARADELWIERSFGGPDREAAAERLLREAIAEDPEFASAHIHLAWSLMRQGRPLEEYRPHAERALALAAGATPVERYFIRGSYHRFLENYKEALAQFQALVELDPTHFWGLHNVIECLGELGRGPEMAEAAVRAAEALPNSPLFASRAAALLVIFQGRVDEGRAYLERALPLYGDQVVERTAQFRDSFALHELWLDEDVESLVARLEETVESMGSWTPEVRAWIVGNTVALFLDLGMYGRAAEVAELYGQWNPQEWGQLMAWRRRDAERLREILPRDEGENPHRTSDRALWLAQVGLADEAETLLARLPAEEDLGEYGTGNVLAARGTIEFARERYRQAITPLEEALKRLRFQSYLGHYLTTAMVLSRAWEALGHPERALRVLEEASAQRPRLLEGARFYWMEVELRRAELYRGLGRTQEAEAIEARLRKLCAYADPDFPVLQELERRREGAPPGDPVSGAREAARP